jgi:hypothetical protein
LGITSALPYDKKSRKEREKESGGNDDFRIFFDKEFYLKNKNRIAKNED